MCRENSEKTGCHHLARQIRTLCKIETNLMLLPKTNCKECGQPTCMVFAARMTEGVKGPEGCPSLGVENKLRLAEYMRQFKFDG